MSKPDLKDFRKIVLEHEFAIRTCIRVMGIRDGYVDDLAQETFILAYNKFETFDQSRSLRAWLLGLAKNLVLNERRKNSRRNRLISEKYSILISENYHQNEKTKLEKYDLNVLNKCLDKLPEKHRRVVTMRYFKNRNSTEIGTALNKEPSNIRHMLRRILESLKVCVNREKYQSGEGLL